MLRVVLDTNLIVAALRSTRGASRQLLDLLAEGQFAIVSSVAMHLEYDEQLQLLVYAKIASQKQADDTMDFLSLIAEEVAIQSGLRPILPDPDDDFVAELAVSAGADYLVTYNLKDFVPLARYGVKVVTPRELLSLLRGVL